MNFSAVILAGGKSSRMGRDKAWLEIGGQTLLARQIGIVRELGAAEVFISGRADADSPAFGCRVLQDKFPGAGPLAGIERGIDAAKMPMLLVLAVDLPEMSVNFLQRLAVKCSETCGVIPKLADGSIEPLVAFYPTMALGLLVNLLDVSFPLAPVLPHEARENRSPSPGKSTAEFGGESMMASEDLQRPFPLPGGRGAGEGKPVIKKSASVKHFAGLCVQSGLARYIECNPAEARYFTNWNAPADLEARHANGCLTL